MLMSSRRHGKSTKDSRRNKLCRQVILNAANTKEESENKL